MTSWKRKIIVLCITNVHDAYLTKGSKSHCFKPISNLSRHYTYRVKQNIK